MWPEFLRAPSAARPGCPTIQDGGGSVSTLTTTRSGSARVVMIVRSVTRSGRAAALACASAVVLGATAGPAGAVPAPRGRQRRAARGERERRGDWPPTAIASHFDAD